MTQWVCHCAVRMPHLRRPFSGLFDFAPSEFDSQRLRVFSSLLNRGFVPHSQRLRTKSEGQAVRVVPCSIALTCMLVAINGCQLFNKKSDDGPFLGAKNKDKATETKPADPLAGGAGGIAELDGVIAGRVIDGVGQPADAQIRWVCLDAPKQPESPILVAVNAQGYFMIQGLQSGKRYKLTTLAKSGDKTLEVVTMTEAPNVHLVIHVNERFAVPTPDKGKKAAGNAKEQPASVQIQSPGSA